MKILICSDTYIYQTNGVVTVLITLVNGLRKLDHEVKVLAPSDCRKSFRKGDDYFIRSVPALYYPGERLCLTRRDPLLDELDNWKPDLIHFHTEGMIGRAAIRFAKKTNTPIVMTTHTDFAKYAFGRFNDSLPVREAARAVGKLFYPPTDAIIAPSEKSRDFYWLRPYKDKITVIPSGICLERIQRPVSKTEKTLLLRKYGLEDNGFTLVIVARISKEKNIMEILRYIPTLVRALPKAQLIIAGDGPYLNKLKKHCVHHSISEHVRFTGGIAPDDVYRYYAMGDVFVSASTFETQGMTYLEAMACGLPQVCRDDGCLAGVIENGKNGFLYHTEQDFVAAVSKILLNRQLWEKMSACALEMAAGFSDKRFVQQIIALYKKALGNYSEPPRVGKQFPRVD